MPQDSPYDWCPICRDLRAATFLLYQEKCNTIRSREDDTVYLNEKVIHTLALKELSQEGLCTYNLRNRPKRLAGYTLLVVGACAAAPLLLFTLPAAAVVALAVLAGICALIGLALLAIVSKNLNRTHER